jgi:hypothetical protein
MLERKKRRSVALQPHQISINTIAQVAPGMPLRAENKVDLANFPRHSPSWKSGINSDVITLLLPVLWCDGMIGIKGPANGERIGKFQPFRRQIHKKVHFAGMSRAVFAFAWLSRTMIHIIKGTKRNSNCAHAGFCENCVVIWRVRAGQRGDKSLLFHLAHMPSCVGLVVNPFSCPTWCRTSIYCHFMAYLIESHYINAFLLQCALQDTVIGVGKYVKSVVLKSKQPLRFFKVHISQFIVKIDSFDKCK